MATLCTAAPGSSAGLQSPNIPVLTSLDTLSYREGAVSSSVSFLTFCVEYTSSEQRYRIISEGPEENAIVGITGKRNLTEKENVFLIMYKNTVLVHKNE